MIVVGNWVVGGAGKTPTTLAVLNHLRHQGWTPGVVSRGHGRKSTAVRTVDPMVDTAEAVGDEPLLIARSAGVPVVVGRHRDQALALLREQHPAVNVVVSDDGLQHHRLARQLEIVVVDERGAGNGWCLPAGPLREPIPQALRPHTLVLYSAGRETLPLPGYRAERHLGAVQSLEDWQAGHAWPADGGWQALEGRPVEAAAGIAVPERFFDLLRAQGLLLTHTHALPDHDAWQHPPWSPATDDGLVTEKDAVKLARRPDLDDLERTVPAPGSPRVWVARLDFQLPATFLARVDELLAPWRPQRDSESPWTTD